MPEDYLRLGALASLGLAARAVETRTPEQGIALRELPPPALLNLRLWAEAATATAWSPTVWVPTSGGSRPPVGPKTWRQRFGWHSLTGTLP